MSGFVRNCFGPGFKQTNKIIKTTRSDCYPSHVSFPGWDNSLPVDRKMGEGQYVKVFEGSERNNNKTNKAH